MDYLYFFISTGRYWSMEGVGGEQVALAPEQQQSVTTTTAPTSSAAVVVEERWFESEEGLSWTTSKIARYFDTIYLVLPSVIRSFLILC